MVGLALASLILSAGIVCAVSRFKDADRVVAVRGLAEKDVEANLAIWAINWSVTSHDLNELSATLARQSEQIRAFLLSSGVLEKEIEVQPAAIRDKKAEMYNQQELEFRYSGKGNLAVKSPNIAAIKKAVANMDGLLQLGIVFGDNGFITYPEYLYTDLNSVKPEMIAQATKNAREGAIKFAEDSESKLGKIKRASQGLFEIFNRDSLSPEKKTIRVVTTVEYRLEG